MNSLILVMWRNVKLWSAAQQIGYDAKIINNKGFLYSIVLFTDDYLRVWISSSLSIFLLLNLICYMGHIRQTEQWFGFRFSCHFSIDSTAVNFFWIEVLLLTLHLSVHVKVDYEDACAARVGTLRPQSGGGQPQIFPTSGLGHIRQCQLWCGSRQFKFREPGYLWLWRWADNWWSSGKKL